MRNRYLITGACLTIGLVYIACEPATGNATYTVSSLAGAVEITPGATPITTVNGFRQPESVRYDPEQDVFFVSNMEGLGSAKDNRGYIVKVAAGDYAQASVFVESGRDAAVLNAPKGLAIRDSILWVADIDVLRGFDRRTGRPVANIDFKPHGALLLNDVALGPDGLLYVTDTGIVMAKAGTIYQGGSQIFAVTRAGDVQLVANGPELKYPNGVTWDSAGARWIVVSFDPFESTVYSLARAADGSTRLSILARGPGQFDGVEALQDGSLIVTCWDDYSIHWIKGEQHRRIATNVYQPADIGLDTRRNRLLVPSVLLGRVEVWALNLE